MGSILKRFTIVALCLLFVALRTALHAAEHTITPAQWQQLTNDKAFDYKNDIETITQPKTIEPGIISKIVSFLFGFLGSGIGLVLLWFIVITIVSYLVYRIFFSKDSFLFGKNNKPASAGEQEQQQEDINTTNWEALLQQAISNNDLRQAVRCRYMWLLQMLQRHNLIQYHTGKTNYEYYTELMDTQYRQPFKQLSRQYEYTWYGMFALSPATYKEYTDLFDNLRKQLGA